MWSVAAVLIVILGGLVAVVKYLRGAESDGAALSTRDDELEVERERVRQMEAAAAEARKARREALREKVTAADSDDTDKLLRELTGADDPNVN